MCQNPAHLNCQNVNEMQYTTLWKKILLTKKAYINCDVGNYLANFQTILN